LHTNVIIVLPEEQQKKLNIFYQMKKITSAENSEIKNIIKLKKPRERKQRGLIVVEGRHEISMAVSAGIKIKMLYVSSDFSSDMNFEIDLSCCTEVSEGVFKKISSRENPDGFLALALMKELELERIKLSANPLIVILDGIEKPGNIGAIVRTCDAVKADTILICGSQSDVYNQNTIRASLGTIFTKQIAVCSVENAIFWLKKNNISICATSLEAKKNYTERDYRKSLALVIGAEHEGISKQWLKAGADLIKIPMLGKIDSLNASVSAGVVLYEVVRQRLIDKQVLK
jgi:RNA methyltransferase, TrmH family